jgi:hypothetical protein
MSHYREKLLQTGLNAQLRQAQSGRTNLTLLFFRMATEESSVSYVGGSCHNPATFLKP